MHGFKMNMNYSPGCVSVFVGILFLLFCGTIASFNCFTACKQNESLCKEKKVALIHMCILDDYVFRFEFLEWRRWNEPIGKCILDSCRTFICDYNCVPLESYAKNYNFETCGAFCFSFSIKMITSEDFANFYINVTSENGKKSYYFELHVPTLQLDIPSVSNINNNSLQNSFLSPYDDSLVTHQMATEIEEEITFYTSKGERTNVSQSQIFEHSSAMPIDQGMMKYLITGLILVSMAFSCAIATWAYLMARKITR